MLFLLAAAALGQDAPRWVNDRWREMYFPLNQYFTGFVSEFAPIGEPVENARARMESEAKRKLMESIRVTVESSQTIADQSVEENGVAKQLLSSYSSVINTSSNAEIVGMKAESYYDRGGDMLYAFAYANKGELKEYYRSGVAFAVQKIETAMQSARQQESSGNKGRAKRLYESVQPLLAELELAQSLLIAVGSSKESIQTGKSLALKSELTAALARMQRAIAVYITSEEWNIDQQVHLLAPRLKAELAKRGYNFVTTRQSADWLLRIEAFTHKGTETNGIYITHLDAEISLVERQTGKEIYGNVFSGFKGGGLDYKMAGRKAYDNGLQAIADEIVKSIEK
jgi:hypothetical protein